MKKLIIYIINIPLYYFSYLVKKDPNLWIYGAWAGQKYADNSKYFFEYIANKHPQIKSIWITKNKRVYTKLLKKNIQVEYAYSIKGYWLSMRAKVAIISNSKLGDLNGFVLNNKTTLVQLWHGNPIKKIAYDTTSKSKYKRNEKLIIFFPWLKDTTSLFCVTSNHVIKFFQSAFRINKEKIIVTGYPRNDELFKNQENTKNIGFKAIYMPTYRENLDEEMKLINKLNFKKLNRFLQEYNIFLSIKLHPQSQLLNTFKINETKNIQILEVEDIYQSLSSFDILITDYSSIYFDFLLLNKPIILAPFDLEAYTSERGVYQNYKSEFKEHIAFDWDEIMANLKTILIDNIDLYKNERHILTRTYNKHMDSNNSSRVYESIKHSLEKGI